MNENSETIRRTFMPFLRLLFLTLITCFLLIYVEHNDALIAFGHTSKTSCRYQKLPLCCQLFILIMMGFCLHPLHLFAICLLLLLRVRIRIRFEQTFCVCVCVTLSWVRKEKKKGLEREGFLFGKELIGILIIYEKWKFPPKKGNGESKGSNQAFSKNNVNNWKMLSHLNWEAGRVVTWKCFWMFWEFPRWATFATGPCQNVMFCRSNL